MRKILTITILIISVFGYDVTNAQTSANPSEQTNPTPSYQLRILDHWDNPNGTVERGYAGRSLFWKEGGVANLDTIREYGRRCQEIGINGTVLNNVNAKAIMLTTAKLKETKRIADALRPYGMKVYLSINFASPKVIGSLKTADPLDSQVIKWWQRKAKEIYKLIPDFGGFLVKANSEGEPGPMDYGRNHADGANMLADALIYGQKAAQPHNRITAQPIIMWRAFVYSPKGNDRASQAYDEFMPLDGQFRDNVIIQIKNGPIDFQPREPISPLFLAMKHTKMMIEVQLTQEYTGESIHTCFMPWYDQLSPLFRDESFKNKDESLDANKPSSFIHRPSTFKNIIGIAGVANIGTNNWCGSTMTQSNWYAFGRMTMDNTLSKEQIARDWLSKTYSTDERFLKPMTRVLVESHEAVVRYMMPLGLHHIFAGGHHYGPEPWCNPKGWREDWKPVYYHKAAKDGVGFNRSTSGTNNVSQYPDSLARIYNNVETCPEQYLLWFHHLPWTHRMHNGETLWDALCHTYDQGVREAEAFAKTWRDMKPYISNELYEEQLINFDRQAKDAWWWRDACLLYFQTFSAMPFPIDSPAPRHTLDALMKFHLDMENYTRADVTKLP